MIILEKYYDDDEEVVSCIEYYDDKNQLHREDGPARIEYYEDGGIQKEEYYIRSKLHREGKPAVVHYGYKESVDREEFYLHNKLHRNDGPAVVDFPRTICTSPFSTSPKDCVILDRKERYFIDGDEVLCWFAENGIDPQNMSEEDIVAFKLTFA